VAAAYLGGASIDALVDEASRLHPWFWVRGWGGGLLSGTKLGVLIDEFLPRERFEDLSAPLAVLATDMDTGQGVVFKSGSVRDAVRASCSFPGVFPPFLLDGRRLYDGGVTDVVPVKLARELAGDEARGGRRPSRSWPSLCAPVSPCFGRGRASSFREPIS
jgi:NTE family protein